jgi:hypothetical protein
MQFIMNIQVLVEAESPEEAAQKWRDGEAMAFGAINPKPQRALQPQQQQRPVSPVRHG